MCVAGTDMNRSYTGPKNVNKSALHLVAAFRAKIPYVPQGYTNPDIRVPRGLIRANGL